MTFANGDAFSGPAIAVVTASGYGITMNVNPPPPCATGSGPSASALLGYTLINVVVSPSQLTAVSGRMGCSGISFGSVSLSRQ